MGTNFECYRFEELDVWKIGMNIVHEIYNITKDFPRDELYGLRDQLKRASTSVVLNIAEGSGQPTSKGFCVYIHRAKSSVLECVAALKIALQEKFIKENDVDEVFKILKEEYFKLIALEKSIKTKND